MNAPVNIDYAALIREDTPDGFLVNSRLYQDEGVFRDELAWFTPHGWRDDVGASKRAAIAPAERRGERVIAMVDSNLDVLAALAECDYGDDRLFIHSADLLQQSQARPREWHTPEVA